MQEAKPLLRSAFFIVGERLALFLLAGIGISVFFIGDIKPVFSENIASPVVEKHPVATHEEIQPEVDSIQLQNNEIVEQLQLNQEEQPSNTPAPTNSPTPSPTLTPTPTVSPSSTPTLTPTSTPTPTIAPTNSPTPTVQTTSVDPNSDEIWEKIADCESHKNWSINTGNGYFGGLQFSQGAWESVGGMGNPASASREEQIMRGKLLQQKRGWGVWGMCAKQLGLN